MFVNKQFKQIYDLNENQEFIPYSNNTNIKSSSTKNYSNINFNFLPKLNDVIDKKKQNKYSYKRNYPIIELPESTNTDFKEELTLINTLWDELGITEDYKYQFNQILDLNLYDQKIIFIQEIENLQKFKNALIKLKKEIFNRENNIQNLIKIIKILDTDGIFNQNLLKEIINIIKNLRLNAVNIIIYINRVRELGFYYYFQGKWDLTKIKKEFMYNNNYLLQMNQDLSFLKNSSISDYIQMGNGTIDAFLTNCSQLNKNNYLYNNNNKIIIPISDDLTKLIEQSIHYVIQDQIIDNIYQQKSEAANKINSMNGMNRSNSMKIKIKKLPNRPMTSKGFLGNNNKYRNNFGQNKKNERKSESNIFTGLDNNKFLQSFKNLNNSDYSCLFQSSSKLGEQNPKLMPESTRIKNRVREIDDNNNTKNYNNSDQKRIIKIEHELMSSYNFLNNDSNKNRTYLNNNNNSQEKIIIENEKLKKDNIVIKNELLKLSKKIEDNEKFKKNLEDKLNTEMEKKVKEEIEKNIKIKQEKKEKENNIINKQIQIQIYKKQNMKKNDKKYKIEYYIKDINLLINELKINKFNDNIELKLKNFFEKENNIYNKEIYLIGQYPKILILKSNDNNNQINGICSFYYEIGILYINFIYIIKDKDNIFDKISNIINYIKEHEKYNKIIINLNNKNKNSIDQNLINYLKYNLGFNYNIDNNKNQLFYINKDIKEEYNNNIGCINSNSISLLSFIKKENINIIDNNININNYKYINNIPLYILLLNQKKYIINSEKLDKNLESNILNLTKEKNNNIITLLFPENKNLDEVNSKINDINIINKIKSSLCFNNNINIESFGLINLNINIFFKNILYLKYNNYYYNKILSDQIELIKDNINSCIIYNIPTLNPKINILILELNETMKNILINNKNNIYEIFINYYQNFEEKIIKKYINILIPVFKLEKHLQSKTDLLNLNIGYIDEYLKFDFNKNIDEQVNYDMNNKDNKDIIISNEFIFGIIYNDDNNNDNNNILLLQLVHVTKEDWVKI